MHIPVHRPSVHPRHYLTLSAYSFQKGRCSCKLSPSHTFAADPPDPPNKQDIMWLSMLSVWGSLLTLVTSQSCPDPENSASWVRLKPLGQCKDDESTCPYRITLPSLTVQLPKPFRELEKMAKELQSLTQMVNQLKEDCHECKERQGMDWNIRADNEGEDGERIQAYMGTLKTKERQQDMGKRERTVQMNTSGTSDEEPMMISSDAKDINPSAFGKERNTNPDRNVNPHTTKTRTETKGGPKGSMLSHTNPMNRSMSKVLQSPVAPLNESVLSGDQESEQPTQHEKHKANTMTVEPETYPGGTLTAEGKVKSIPEYHEVSIVTEDYDDYIDITNQLPTTKSDTFLGERQLGTATDDQNNRELQPNMKQHTKKHQDIQDKEEVADTGLDESTSNISNDTNNGNIAKESSASVVQQPDLKNKERSENKDHVASFTKRIPIKPGAYSEMDDEVNSGPVNSEDTIKGQKTLTSPFTGRAYASVNVSQNKSKSAFKPDTDAKMNIGTESIFNETQTVRVQDSSRSPISGIKYGIVDVSPTNPQTLYSKKQLVADTESESDTGMNSKPVNKVETISGLKNSRLPISSRVNSTGDMNLLNPKDQISSAKTTLKSSKESNSNIEINSNPINPPESSRSPSTGITDGIVDGRPTNLQKLDTKSQFRTGTNSETGDLFINSRSSLSERADSTVDTDLINPQSLHSQNLFKHGTDVKSNTGIDSHAFNTSDTVNRLQMQKSPISEITGATEMDSNPRKVEIKSPLEMQQHLNTGRTDARVNVNQLNQQKLYSNSEDSTAVSTPVNKVETVRLESTRSPITGRYHTTADQINPQSMDYVSSNPLESGTNSERKAGRYPNRDNTTGIHSRQEASESTTFDYRLVRSGTNTNRSSYAGLPKRQLLPKSKFNMTQPWNGQIRSSHSMSIDAERKKAQSSNKTTLLRNIQESGRLMPTGLRPERLDGWQEITKQAERTSPTGISLSKDPRRRKPYIIQRKPINDSKAFGLGESKNSSGVNVYTTSNRTARVGSRIVSISNNRSNSRLVRPTLTTQRTMDQAHVQRAKTVHTVEVLHTMLNHQTESTSQPSVMIPRLEKPGGNSGQDMVLDTVNNIARGSQPPAVEETKGTDRRKGQPPFKTSSVDSNQENHRKPLTVGNIQDLAGKMPLAVLSHSTTASTPFVIQTDFKDKHSKMPQLTPTDITPPLLMDQDHVEQAKTTSGMNDESNKHVHHSASNAQWSGGVTGFQPEPEDRIQNRATGTRSIIMDIVKASGGSKVSTTSTESTNENRARDSSLLMDQFEASTEVNWVTPSSVNSPYEYHRRSKTPLGSVDLVEGNNGGHSTDNNNGNSSPFPVNRMTGTSISNIPNGHTNKKPVTGNNMNDRHGFDKQLLSNCQGHCDLSPASQSILNSHESSNNDRDKPYQDCSDFIIRNPTSGIYNVTPSRSGNRSFPVLCDMKSSGGGWTLIQHRFNGSISFNRTWNDYKRGFGNLTGEFWLGNDKIHWLTATKPMALRIELEDLDGIKEYAQYNQFHVGNESQYYRLTIEGYSGTAGDAMQYNKKFNHNQKNFTTPDRDNDQYTSGNCGAYYSSGWWFDACMAANLNGKYYKRRYRGVRNGIFWGTWHNISAESYLTHERQSFMTVKMMIRPSTELLMD